MMNYNRGEIVLIRFPMPDLTQFKPRPALVIQNDLNNVRLDNMIFLQITTNISRKSESTQYFISVNTDEGKLSGLLSDSVIKAELIFTLPKNFIYKKLGELSNSSMKNINNCVKISLGLE